MKLLAKHPLTAFNVIGLLLFVFYQLGGYDYDQYPTLWVASLLLVGAVLSPLLPMTAWGEAVVIVLTLALGVTIEHWAPFLWASGEKARR